MNPGATISIDGGQAVLPDAVTRFIESAVVTGDMALPFHYPRLQDLDAWQSGFRRHGISGESLVSTAPGAWQPGWVVIALNGFDDPFFVNIAEAAQGFPVYYAPLGAGRWDALPVAPNLLRFGQMLSTLHALADNDVQAMRYIEAEGGLANALWREAHECRRSRPALEQELAQHQTPRNQPDWQYGTLVLSAAGPQRVKVAQILRQMLDLPLQQALALAAAPDSILAEGYLVHLRDRQRRLMAVGAIVAFRPHE